MKTTTITAVVLSLVLGAYTASAGRVTVTNVTAVQRSGAPVVDIAYDLLNPSGGLHGVTVEISTNGGVRYNIAATNFSGAVGANVSTGTHKEVVWFAAGDLPEISGVAARVRVTAMEDSGWYYCIVDVSGGPHATNYPVSYQTYAPPQDDTHKTSKIVLRIIPAGSFVMGSPSDELGRDSDEGPQHTVTLTQPFYIGIFEITQAQYQNVMGTNPAYFTQGAHAPKRPVERVSWHMVRGGTWPGGTPASTTFMGKLRSKTGLNFDLPTEAQWEYACRAGTTTSLNNGQNITNIYSDGNMNLVGRYWYNGGSSYSSDPVNGAHATVGSYMVNQWGLCDMHGNVWEWCLDRYASSYGGDATDPAGPASGSYRVTRGGSWDCGAGGCRSAGREYSTPDSGWIYDGFRLSLPAGQ